MLLAHPSSLGKPPSPAPSQVSQPSDEPFLFALINGLCEVGVVVHDGSVGALGGLGPLGFIRVVGALVTEHVPDEEDQGAEDGENDHGDDPWWAQKQQGLINKGELSLRCCCCYVRLGNSRNDTDEPSVSRMKGFTPETSLCL